MEFQCSQCEHTISYKANPPKFCPECGLPNEGLTTAVPSDVTIAPTKDATDLARQMLPLTSKTKIANYELVRQLGSGGMGVVWEAIDDKTKRRVALKTLLRQNLGDDETVQRFIREGKLAAKLSHPNVTFIYGAGEFEGKHFIAMELMPGNTVEDKIVALGKMGIGEGVDAILDVIDGLISAHRLGLIHRDVKPSNCFVAEDGSVKIGDFGLSKSTISVDMNLTQDATFLGTPSYSAPEQIRGSELDGRTDIYAIGATLYKMLTGRTPFIGESIAVTAQIIADPASPARSWNPEIPKPLDRIILKCLEKSPDNRFQTLTKLRTALAPFGSRGTSLADVGRRLSAYMIDHVIVNAVLISLAIGLAVVGVFLHGGTVDQTELESNVNKMRPLFILVSLGLLYSYFVFFESLFGKTPGKHLLQLQVINDSNNKPGFWRTILRVFAFPASFGIPAIYQFFFAGEYHIDSASNMLLILSSVLIWSVPLLACFSTMRTTNGLRGLHGFMSGTRVQRIHSKQTQNFVVPACKPKTKAIEPKTFGPFVADQFLCDTVAGSIYMAHDNNLDRDVWIYESPSGVQPSTARIELSRPGRQRWLDGDVTDDGQRWDAYEPVEGYPFLALVGSKRHGDWSNYRLLLEQAAAELSASINDKTIPETLFPSQVIVSELGNLKFLDRHPLDVIEKPQTLDHPQTRACATSPDNDAVCLFMDLAEMVSRRNCDLPFSAQDFFAELKTKPHEPSTLDWAVGELASLSKSLPALKWDSRVGVFGITLGFELITQFVLATFIFLWAMHFSPFAIQYKLLAGMVASLALPVALGVWFKGGPVFSLMRIGVATRKGKPASRFRCGMRSLMAWLCPTALIGCSTMISALSQIQGGVAEPGTFVQQFQDNDAVLGSVLIVFAIAILGAMIGSFVAVLNPTRGLQDYAVGTRLTPK